MPSVCLYLQTHQPFRLKNYSVFDIGGDDDYFDQQRNYDYLARITRKSYLRTNKILLDLIRQHQGHFKIAFGLSGVLLEQLEKHFPEVIGGFQELVKTGCCEILAETYHHSLAYLYSPEEFKAQIALHRRKIKSLFGYSPKAFRNTELMLSNEMARAVEEMGYKTILGEGADYILGWRSPNYVYKINGAPKIKALLRNYKLSDDISFRFSTRDWSEWPLTAEKFAAWVRGIHGHGDLINLFMDYETFGEHQWEETGIFEFLKNLPGEILKYPENNFQNPSDVIKLYKPAGELDFPHIVTWADTERDLSAWLGNKMQQEALNKIYSLETQIKKNKNERILEQWRKLQTSDHFYYMCVKWFADGDVHKYFSPYDSPYDAFIVFMNIFNDLKLRLA
ncbi:MAG: glycoside hydrolase family 57 protein [Candidatus Pacebacteria bacterium]|nr:glycoside hydrolase family 57 protein [Candidatus Paceibacterota bacterium]